VRAIGAPKGALEDILPDSIHVRSLHLERANDDVVWDYARDDDLVIVSEDADFHQLSFARGHPPKVVWIRRGNCSTNEVEAMLRIVYRDLLEFEANPEASFLMLD
jgi:predicted nuclease of predicted toxin-antitoxin system